MEPLIDENKLQFDEKEQQKLKSLKKKRQYDNQQL